MQLFWKKIFTILDFFRKETLPFWAKTTNFSKSYWGKRVGVKHSKVLYAITTALHLSQTLPSRIKRPQEQIKGNSCNHFGEILTMLKDLSIGQKKSFFSFSNSYKKIPRFLERKFGIPNILGLWSKEPQIKEEKINRKLFFLFWIITRLLPDFQIYYQIVVRRTSEKWKTFKEMLTFRL